MQVDLETTSNLGRVMKVTIPSTNFEQAIEKRFKEVVSEFNNVKNKHARPVNGFRVGKIPPAHIKQQYGTKIREEALNNLIATTLQDLLKERNLQVAGMPTLQEVKAELGQDVHYQVSFELYPEVKLMDFASLTVEKPEAEITEQDVEQELNKLKEQFATFVTDKERLAEVGDKVNLTYTSTINGKSYEHSDSEAFTVVLGQNQLLKDFEENLLGVKEGAHKEFTFIYPQDWRIADIAGKAADFKVIVHKVEKRMLPELDAEFAKKIKAEGEDKAAIFAKVKSNLERLVKSIGDDVAKEQITTKLVENLNFELPTSLVDKEIETIHQELHSQHQHNETCNHEHKDLEKDARRRVALSLILRTVIDSQNIRVDKERVRARFNSFARMFNNTDFLENRRGEANELLARIENSVLVDQALDFVASQVTYVPKKTSAAELIANNQ